MDQRESNLVANSVTSSRYGCHFFSSFTSCRLTNSKEDLKSWYPELASRIRITLVEALPNVLPSFSKELIAYTERTFKESDIDILTKTMVRKVNEKSVVLKGPDGVEREVPCGMVVWAAVCSVLVVVFLLFHVSPHRATLVAK